MSGADDDALEAALGLGDLASLTITNEADPLSYDVSFKFFRIAKPQLYRNRFQMFYSRYFCANDSNCTFFLTQISSSKEAFRKTWNAKYTLRRYVWTQ